MKLNQDVIGPASGLPTLLVHGLFGQGRNLGALARRLADNRPVITVDLRNHGDSPHSEDHGYADLADDLAGVIEAAGGKANLVGHSMGGKAAMVLAQTRPQLIRKLAVLDIAPIAYDHSQTGLIEAMQALDLDGLDRRSEADRRLAAVIDDPGLRAFLLQSLDLKARPARWRLNLPVLHRAMDQITGWPEDLPKGRFTGPALFLAGQNSDYVGAAGEAAIRNWFPQGRIVRLKGAGHWLHADAPEATARTLAAFLSEG